MPSEDLFAGLFADLSVDAVPAFPTSQGAGGSWQAVVIADTSRHSQPSHPENGPSRNFDPEAADAANSDPAGSRVARSCVWEVGTAGSVGTGSETPAGTPTYDFPPPSLSIGKKEDNWEVLSLPAGCTSISPAAVRAGVERELRALAEDGREGPDALRDAVAITAAKIRNSEALAERQANGAACHACDARLDDTAPVVAVLTGRRGAHLYLHAGCCEAFSARRADLVSRIMASAGYGADPSGAAA